MWKVSGITTDFSKQSQMFWDLGHCISEDQNGDFDGDPSDYDSVIQGIKLGREALNQYFYLGEKSLHDHAVRFLVMTAAYTMGKDGYSWNWEHVRHVSQGLYGSMDEARDDFRRENMTLFDLINDELDEFLGE